MILLTDERLYDPKLQANFPYFIQQELQLQPPIQDRVHIVLWNLKNDKKAPFVGYPHMVLSSGPGYFLGFDESILTMSAGESRQQFFRGRHDAKAVDWAANALALEMFSDGQMTWDDRFLDPLRLIQLTPNRDAIFRLVSMDEIWTPVDSDQFSLLAFAEALSNQLDPEAPGNVTAKLIVHGIIHG